MQTFLIRRDPAAEDAFLSSAPEGTCVVLTILGRLNSHVQSVPIVRGLAVHFGWTEEMALDALVQQAPMSQQEAEFVFHALCYSTLIDHMNDTSVARLFFA